MCILFEIFQLYLFWLENNNGTLEYQFQKEYRESYSVYSAIDNRMNGIKFLSFQ